MFVDVVMCSCCWQDAVLQAELRPSMADQLHYAASSIYAASFDWWCDDIMV